jgi:ABC-type sulfate transport system substrate-binding protein
MFFTQADNLGDALRIQAEPTLAANVVIPKMATVEEYDAQGVALTIEQLGGEDWARHYFPYLFTGRTRVTRANFGTGAGRSSRMSITGHGSSAIPAASVNQHTRKFSARLLSPGASEA